MSLITARRVSLFAACLAACAWSLTWGASPAVAQWGNLKVKFVYNGSTPAPVKLDVNKDTEVCGKTPLFDESLVVGADGGIANVVVYVRTKDVKVNPEYEKSAGDKLEYDNKGCRFEPHVLTIRLSQTLVLKNTDPVGHNSNLQPLGDVGVNPLLPAGGAVDYKFNRSQFVPAKITCNIHPWMNGWILPRDNPYAAVSKADGSLEIKNLPAGELEFQAWHEKAGYLAIPAWEKGRFKHTIKDGDNDLGVIKVDAALFNK